jgi:hypothetical protein
MLPGTTLPVFAWNEFEVASMEGFLEFVLCVLLYLSATAGASGRKRSRPIASRNVKECVRVR